MPKMFTSQDVKIFGREYSMLLHEDQLFSKNKFNHHVSSAWASQFPLGNIWFYIISISFPELLDLILMAKGPQMGKQLLPKRQNIWNYCSLHTCLLIVWKIQNIEPYLEFTSWEMKFNFILFFVAQKHGWKPLFLLSLSFEKLKNFLENVAISLIRTLAFLKTTQWVNTSFVDPEWPTQ